MKPAQSWWGDWQSEGLQIEECWAGESRGLPGSMEDQKIWKNNTSNIGVAAQGSIMGGGSEL
jgi:hypothetical protein